VKKKSTNTEITLNQSETNKKILLYIFPIVLFLALPYLLFWNKIILKYFKIILIEDFYITLLALIGGIIFHELLHGFTWAILSKKGVKSVKFGFSKINLSPYCHCKFPIKLKYYICGGLMPALILGILPSLISWFTGNLALLLFGMVFTIGAGSDLLICWKLRKVNMNSLVQDSPDKTGCYLIENEAQN